MKAVIKNFVPKQYHQLFYSMGPKNICHILLRRLCRKRLVLIVGSPHRTGSTWLRGIIRDLYHFQNAPVPGIFRYPTCDPADVDLFKLINYFRKLNGYFIFKSHALPIPQSLDPDDGEFIKLVTIIRDPRDVIVSAAFHLVNLKEERGGWGEEFMKLDDVAKILAVIKSGYFLLTLLEKWYETPFAYRFTYENLKSRPIDELNGMADYLGLSFNKNRAQKVIQKHSFISQTGRRSGFEDRKVFGKRKGIVGDWKNYFNGDSVAAFKEEHNGRWNELLVKMGYEKKLNWG